MDCQGKETWTFNSGGLAGLWRLIETLEDLKRADRPLAVCVQEVSCDVPRWKIVLKRLNFLGCHVFANGQVEKAKARRAISH